MPRAYYSGFYLYWQSSNFKARFAAHVPPVLRRTCTSLCTMYDPAVGRFITADSLIPEPGNSQAFNRYAFCAGSPIDLMDSDGHSWYSSGSSDSGSGDGYDSNSTGGNNNSGNSSSGGAVIQSAGAAICGAVSKGISYASSAISSGITKMNSAVHGAISAIGSGMKAVNSAIHKVNDTAVKYLFGGGDSDWGKHRDKVAEANDKHGEFANGGFMEYGWHSGSMYNDGNHLNDGDGVTFYNDPLDSVDAPAKRHDQEIYNSEQKTNDYDAYKIRIAADAKFLGKHLYEFTAVLVTYNNNDNKLRVVPPLTKENVHAKAYQTMAIVAFTGKTAWNIVSAPYYFTKKEGI